MDSILHTHAQLESKSNLSKALTDVDKLIHLLQTTRDSVAEGPDMAALHMAKLKTPLKQSFDKIEEDLKEVNKGLNQYQKALKDKFKSTTLPSLGGLGGGEGGGVAGQKSLVDRAIAMHLLREGKFDVASTFVKEVNAQTSRGLVDEKDQMVSDAQQRTHHGSWMEDFAEQDERMGDDGEDDDEELYGELGKGHLQRKFADMYHVLDALRNQQNLEPAIEWARQHSHELETRGSNLEFELSRLRFVELYTSTTSDPNNDNPYSGPIRALEYARTTFPSFNPRYTRETSSLLGSLAFSPDLAESPYTRLFTNTTTYAEVSASFTREFTSLLGLPSSSPLYTAITAGGIALPILEKVERIMTASRGQWTSVNELPVETPLPPGYMFHSVFVCPVSKEQGTDANPPMMLPCGHVIARESLEGHSRGKTRVKCAYCPLECRPGEARRVFI